MSAAAVDAAEPLIKIVRGMLRDLRQHEGELRAITLDSSLDRDLGLDSLARVELFTRIEHEFGVRLPESLFETAETLRDIAAALGKMRRDDASSQRPIAHPVRTTTQAVTLPSEAATLDRVLAWRVEQQPGFAQITIVADGADESITHEQLWREAHAVAGGLQKHGVGPGDAVALMLPTSRAYFCSFFGILLAGAVPVPLYPPTRLSQIEEHVRRHAGILNNARASVLITTPEMRRLAGVLRVHAPALSKLLTHEELRSLDATAAPVSLTAGSTALLQYTSGSTGQPKGVVVSHANILTNISALGAALHVRSGEPFVSWLPLYHDMGLIGAWLGSLYLGLPLIIMSPLAFLSRPVRWLEAIHRYRGALSAAPNFAYELCVKRVTDEELAGLDLRTWRIAMNGAEAVRPETLAAFGERFARCGFRSTAMTPVYGLAECAVGLTVPPMDRGPLIEVIDRDTFTQHGVASPANPNTVNPLRFPSCGLPIAGHQVRIVDDAGRELGERHEGRLEFRGPSTTGGYFSNPEATAKLIRDGWLDSGDRAYRAQGEIFVTGRVKDIIIRAGRHIHPEEIEAAVGAIAGIRKGCVAVLGSVDVGSGTERVIVLAETRVDDAAKRDTLRQAIIGTVVKLIGEAPDEVVLAAPHTVLKTSSGKIRRAASRELYESGRHRSASSRSTWMQLLRLSLSAAPPASALVMRRMAHLAYGAYFWGMLTLFGALTLLLLLPSRRPRVNWSIAHLATRLFIRVSGVPFQVHGQEHLQGAVHRILVVNHSSYLDGLFLAAALPNPCRFVAKRELERTPVLGLLLRRINAVFVERFDLRASVEDAHQLADLAAHGDSCVFFPEGTFTRAPGLAGFHLGAFLAAVEAGMPVLPIALRGTRAVLRDGERLPHRAPLVVHIGEAIEPMSARDAFPAAVELRDAARRFIREHCGEADLAGQVDPDSGS